jgi:putative NADH-flavin reductase
MKLIVYGATGRVGSRLVAEAGRRGHEVIAVSRSRDGIDTAREWVAGDILDPVAVADLARGGDVLISAIGSGFTSGEPDFGIYVEASRAVTKALRELGSEAPRIIIVGGAGSLMVGDGMRAVDTVDFPEAVKPEALAHAEALAYWRTVADIDWTYVSPAATLEPGRRTGGYQRGHDQLLFDAAGKSYISMEDFAVAIVDEVENKTASKERISFAN